MSEDTYNRLIRLLDEHGARYRLIDHEPEGRTELVSRMRGNDVQHAAKCMILMVKLGKKTTKFVLAVVPGDRRISFAAVKSLFGGTYVSFASAEIAERLAESVAGTVLPFPMTTEVELVVDPSLRETHELYFNAARLDRSLALDGKDYFRIAEPRLASIVEQTEPAPRPEMGAPPTEAAP